MIAIGLLSPQQAATLFFITTFIAQLITELCEPFVRIEANNFRGIIFYNIFPSLIIPGLSVSSI
jgi:hypothetical protein